MSITMIGLSYGVLQGTQRFAALAGMLAFEAVGRIGGTVIGLVVFRSATGALAGTAIGAASSPTAGWVVCGRPRPARHHKGHVGEVLHAVQAMLALVLLVNLDLVLARHHLPAHEAGEYAVGAIVTKIAYWLPQAVAILVLPRLASEEGRRTMVPRALAICAALDAVVVLGAATMGPTIVAVIGGDEYAAARHSRLALRDRRLAALARADPAVLPDRERRPQVNGAALARRRGRDRPGDDVAPRRTDSGGHRRRSSPRACSSSPARSSRSGLGESNQSTQDETTAAAASSSADCASHP